MPEGTVQDELRDRPIGELLKELSTQTTSLVRQELELAKAEMAEKGKRAGLGAACSAGRLALAGKRKTREAIPPAPEQAIESTKEDVQWAKTRAKSASR
jgi:hypothetical protein